MAGGRGFKIRTKSRVLWEYEGRKVTTQDCDEINVTKDILTIINKGTEDVIIDISEVKNITFTPLRECQKIFQEYLEAKERGDIKSFIANSDWKAKVEIQRGLDDKENIKNSIFK